MTDYPDVRAVYKPAGYDRLLFDGHDMSYWRNGTIPIPPYWLTEPLAYGPMTLPIPRVAADLEELGVGELWFAKEEGGVRVEIQRVDDPTSETPVILATDYVGRGMARIIDGRQLELEIGGEFSGPASVINMQPLLKRRVFDVGAFAAGTIKRLHLRPSQRDGPVTGIKIVDTSPGLTLEAWAREICAESQTSAGVQRSIMPTVWGGKEWGFEPKDTTTVHVTLFTDDARVVARLRDDIAEKPNTFYTTIITPDGTLLRGSKYPNLFDDGGKPPFPGTLSLGDTGDGVIALNHKLAGLFLLDRGDLDFTYDEFGDETEDAVRDVQDRAGLSQTGVVNSATWDAVFDIGTTGGGLGEARIDPSVQDPVVRKFDYTSDGSIKGRNDDFDYHVMEVNRNIDYGVGTHRSMMRHTRGQYAKIKNNKNWVGQVELHGGFGGFAGDWGPEDYEFLNGPGGIPYIMSQRDIRPGMNAKLAMIDGGTLVHVAGVYVDPPSHAATLTVDTMARDLLEVRAIKKRNADSRRSPRREFFTENRPGKASGNMIVHDQWFGKLPHSLALNGDDWNAFKMIMGQQGTVNKSVIETFGDPAKFVIGVWSIPMTEERMRNHIPDPFEIPGDVAWYETEWAAEMLEDHKLLWFAGTAADPCGFWPAHHTNPRTGEVTGNPITGKHVDIGSPWTYFQSWDAQATVYVTMFPHIDTNVRRGQMFWSQENDMF